MKKLVKININIRTITISLSIILCLTITVFFISNLKVPVEYENEIQPLRNKVLSDTETLTISLKIDSLEEGSNQVYTDLENSIGELELKIETTKEPFMNKALKEKNLSFIAISRELIKSAERYERALASSEKVNIQDLINDYNAKLEKQNSLDSEIRENAAIEVNYFLELFH